MYWQYKRVHINDITTLLSTLLLHLLQYEPCTEIRSQAVYYKETIHSDIVSVTDVKREVWSKVTTSIKILSTVSLLRVKVPVLSLQSTSIPAISSIAVILFVIAPCTRGQVMFKLTFRQTKIISLTYIKIWINSRFRDLLR